MSAFKALGLDPKMYKHVKTDDKTTTLQHKQGHVITIAHNVLSPKMQSQLKALANIGKEDQTNSQAQEAQDQQRQKMAKGGSIIPYDEISNYDGGGFVDSIKSAANSAQKAFSGSFGEATRDADAEKAKKRNSRPETVYDKPSNSDAGMYAHGGRAPQQTEPDDSAPQADPNQYQTPMQQPDQTASPAPQEPKKEEANDEIHPDLSKEFGQIIGKYGVAPVAKAADMFIKGGVNAVKSVGRGAGRISQGVEKGVSEALGGNDNPQVQDKEKAATDILNNAKAATPPAGQPTSGDAQKTVNDLESIANSKPDPVTEALQSSQNMLLQGVTDAKEGLDQKAKSEITYAKEQENAVKQNIALQGDAQAAYNKSIEHLNKQQDEIRTAIQSGQLDPEKYWKGDADGNGSHSKIASAIGMIIAGFNPTNSPNAAIKFLQYQMDKNLEAQTKNLDSKQNLLRANLDHYKNIGDAFTATRLQNAEILKNQLLMAQSKATTDSARGAAKLAYSEIERTTAPLAKQFAMTQAISNLASGQSTVPGSVGHMLSLLDVQDPEKAKSYRDRYYAPFDAPGGKSLADRPITSQDREKLNSHNEFDAATKNLQNIVNRHRGLDISRWDPKERALAIQAAQQVQSLYRETTLGTVYKAGEQPLLNKSVSENPLNLIHYFTEPTKIQGLLNANDRSRNTILSGYGLTPPKSAQQAQPQQKEAPQYKEGDFIINRQTGQRLVLRNGQWKPQ
jgi:hypothetical protein